jgi:hypothetical protein
MKPNSSRSHRTRPWRGKPIRPIGANHYRNGERRYVWRTRHDERRDSCTMHAGIRQAGLHFALVGGGRSTPRREAKHNSISSRERMSL